MTTTTTETTMKHWSVTLPADACQEAVIWARTQPSLAAAWAACPRGDWMLWLASKGAPVQDSPERRTLVLAACDCARTALRYVPVSEDRPRLAIETAERWARGEEGVTIEDVRAAAGAAAEDAALSTCADIVRRHYPTPPQVAP